MKLLHYRSHVFLYSNIPRKTRGKVAIYNDLYAHKYGVIHIEGLVRMCAGCFHTAESSVKVQSSIE